MHGKFKLGQMVLVHQPGGIRFTDEGMVPIPHCCSDPNSHWESRIVGWSEYHNMPEIATPCRGERGNPCHAEWPYGEDVLEAIEDEYDWTEGSAHKVGDEVRIRLPEDIPQFKKGKVLEAKILAPHIEPEDWYVDFDVPRDWRNPKPGDTWRFSMVINEEDFVNDSHPVDRARKNPSRNAAATKLLRPARRPRSG